MQKQSKNNIWKIGFTVLVAISVILTFILFMRHNGNSATEISVGSLKDATQQNSQRIDDLLDRSQREIYLTAALYEEILDRPYATAEDLQMLVSESPFDYIEFVDTDGMDLTADGQRADATNRLCYQDGIQGNSGIEAIFSSQVYDQNRIVFYTPMYYENEIIGILLGVYMEDQMDEILMNTFFDKNSRTFLCTMDGEIIASCNYDYVSESIFDKQNFNNGVSDDALDGLRQALQSSEEYEFQYTGLAGTANAYAITLQSNTWCLIQTFPSEITSQFVSDANRAGRNLLIELIAIFLICVVVIQVTNQIQKRRLVKENTEKTYVVDGISHLFRSFVVVDLQENTYHYLADTVPRQGNIATEGMYDDFQTYMVSMVKDPEEAQRLRDLLSRETLLETFGKDTDFLRYEYQICTENSDRQRWDSNNLICLKRVDGVPKEVLFTYQDVSAVKIKEQQSYEALKDAYRAVESANQAKSAFLSNMSHDIRTPMNGIIGMTAIAGAHLHEPERVSDCLQKITVASKHLLGLINEVLDMSKIESGKVDLTEEAFRLPDLIDNLLTMTRTQIEAHKHTLKVNINNITHENVIGDSLRIQQVFMNLVGNAIKYTPDGGRIHLTITEKNTHQAKSGLYEITIEDNGIGMSEEFVQHVFEPFVRAEDEQVNQVQGTGLGMSIARNIVRMMGGDIRVESRLRYGTKVTVTFFLKLQEDTPVSYAKFLDLPVLVADDDKISCESACAILDDMGMKSEWVLSGREAVQRVEERKNTGNDFFAVILDWKMPDMDGITTARNIRKAVGEKIPIIIISAYDWSGIEQEARKAGVNAFISKPLFPSRMVTLFTSLVGNDGKPEEILQAAPLANMEAMHLEGKRVLLVEDNDLNAEIAKEILQATGITVELALNGSEAVDRIDSLPPSYYDLVLMDIQMPVMNGYEATRAIRALGRPDTRMLPIVAMTANAFAEDVEAAKSAGMNGHIPKPLDLDTLALVLQKWLLR